MSLQLEFSEIRDIRVKRLFVRCEYGVVFVVVCVRMCMLCNLKKKKKVPTRNLKMVQVLPFCICQITLIINMDVLPV